MLSLLAAWQITQASACPIPYLNRKGCAGVTEVRVETTATLGAPSGTTSMSWSEMQP